MTTSLSDLQRDKFLQILQATAAPDWKVLVVDSGSGSLLINVANKDDVLARSITDILQIEDSRTTLTHDPAIYLLTPLPHIVDWLKVDLNRRRYAAAHIIWTAQLRNDLAMSLRSLEPNATRIKSSRVLNIDFFPQESHLVTFRDPSSFEILYNPRCNRLIIEHFHRLSQQILSVCIALGEYPHVRYYNPPNEHYAACVLSKELARIVQDTLDGYARNAENAFPPTSTRPRATLLVTDRTMDLMSPLVHELTYQAMAMDLLPIQESADRFTYRNVVRRGQPDQKEMIGELSEKDKIWVENRHLHMKDLLVKISDDFRKFQAKNSQFSDSNGQTISVNTIKDLLAGLPEFQEGKDAFSLHIDMAEKCAKLFQDQKLMDITSLEQSLATGLDEDNQKPRNVTDQLVRLLADESVIPDNRIRLLMMYVIYRGGVLEKDIQKLLRHAELPDTWLETIKNLQEVGARVKRNLGDNLNQYQPLFPAKRVTYAPGEEVSLSRFEPTLKHALEALCQGTLSTTVFPYSNKDLNNPSTQINLAQTSLRSSGKPTWATTRSSAKTLQRVIVFVAGGATYAESRACYETSQQMGKDVFLLTTCLLSPKAYLREVAELNEPAKILRGNQVPQAPAWLNEKPTRDKQQQQLQSNDLAPGHSYPTEAMDRMNLGPPRSNANNSRPASSQNPTPPSTAGSFSTNLDSASSGKLKKEKKEMKYLGKLLRKH